MSAPGSTSTPVAPIGPVVHPEPYATSPSFIAGLQTPTTLLDGTNYVTWSAGFRRFLEIHGRASFLTDDPPPFEDPSFSRWTVQDQAVTAWLLKMAIPVIAEPMHLISPSKAIWDEWARMYGYRSNIGRTVEVVEGLFHARQGDRPLQEFYAELRSLLNQLEIYQPYTADLATQRRYREELAVGLFLLGVNPTLGSQIRGLLLSDAILPTLGEAFSTALRFSTSRPATSTITSSPTDTTALLSSAPRPRGRRPDGEGRGQGRGRGQDGQLYPPCIHCQRYGHRSDRCSQNFGKPDQVANSSTTAPAPTLAPISGPTSLTHVSHMAVPSTSSSGTALTASSPGNWIIDSGASAHMSGTSSLLYRLSNLPTPQFVTIADGRACPVRGRGLATPTSSLPLSDVLYVPNFPVNLISISAITKTLFCSVSFYPYHCLFQDLQTGARIGLGRETGRGIYELVPDLPPTGLRCLLS